MKKIAISLILSSALCVVGLEAKAPENTHHKAGEVATHAPASTTKTNGAKTLATVNGTIITAKDFDFLKERNPNFDFNSLKPDQKRQLVEEAIKNVLVEKEALKEKLNETPDFKAAVQFIKKQLLVYA